MAEARLERRLAAILAADVAGYSRLMGADEEGTLCQLKAHRKELIDPKITEHRGYIVKTTGDGMLVEFVSVVDAVRCAIDIQRVMVDRNAEVPAEKRIEFRIGINVGDIISDEDDIFGDGVNIAARLETLATPGALCLSDSAYQPVKRKVALDVSDMGEFQLKNIVQAVRVYSVRIDAALSAPPTGKLTQSPKLRSIAANRVRTILLGAGAAVALVFISYLFVSSNIVTNSPAPPPRPAPAPPSSEDGDAAYKRGDYTTAFRLFQALAAQGNARARTSLGWMYRNGQGVPKNYDEAVKLYRLAAAQGYTPAQHNLGFMYQSGFGVPKDDAEAVKLYRLAAAQGYAPAQNNLGRMYLTGQGVPKDDAEAVKLYRLAAAQGNATAQNNLGGMFQSGQGVPQDYQAAVKMYRLAAAQGYAPAQGNLGWMYQNGFGVPKDYDEAVKLYRLAVAQGNANAQAQLGGIYQSGQGIPRDYVRSHMWLTISIANSGAYAGGANAETLLRALVANMTSAQIVLAQDLAKRCKESNYKQCGEPEGNQTSSSATPVPTPGEGNQVGSSATPVPMPAAVDASIQPSFDCGKASSWSEKQVCATRQLADYDSTLARIYAEKLAEFSGAERDALRDSQRAWILERDSCEHVSDGQECLVKVYIGRLNALPMYVTDGAKPLELLSGVETAPLHPAESGGYALATSVQEKMDACDSDASKNSQAGYLLIVPLAPSNGNIPLPKGFGVAGKTVLLSSNDIMAGIKNNTMTMYTAPITIGMYEVSTNKEISRSISGISRLKFDPSASSESFRIRFRTKNSARNGDFSNWLPAPEAGRCYWLGALVME